MKDKIKKYINLKTISVTVGVVIIVILIIFINFKGVTKTYVSNSLNYQFSYNSRLHISTDLSKKFDKQSFLLGLYIKAGCSVSDFVKDESSGSEKFEECIKKNPKFKESESLYSEYKNNWSVEKSQYIILTKLSKGEEDKLPISVFPAVINQQWPQGSFIMIRPLEFKLDFPQEDPANSTGLSRTFYKIKDLTGFSTDLRGTTIVSKDISVSVPYSTEKTVYSGAKIQSLVFSTTAEKKSKEEKGFYEVLQSFKLL